MYRLSSHRGLSVVLLLFFLVLPLLTALAILRIADNQQRIGLTWPFTVIWTLLQISFALTSHRYTTAIATAMLRAEQSTNSYIARGRWFGRSLVFLQSLLVVTAYPVLFTNGQSKLASRISVILFLACGSIIYCITGFWTRWVRIQMVKVLTDEHADLRIKMSSTLNEGANFAWFNSIILFILVIIPIFWTVSSSSTKS